MPPEPAVAEFFVDFNENGTGIQRFTDTRPSRQLRWFQPRDSCNTRITTISGGVEIVNYYEQISANNDRWVWETIIDLLRAGSTDPADQIGTQTITWTMDRQ